jgi:PPOX class probable F420-dependent enzyme
MSVYDRIRHSDAERAASEPATARDFGALNGHKYCLLVTFRRDGTRVPTPVWFGLDDDGHVYVQTEEDAFKVKRIRRDSRARVGPCSVRGKPLGPLAEGTARLLPHEQEDRAEAALQANYGLGRRAYEAVRSRFGSKPRYIEVVPV